jgi:energy-coupling factor transport system permease protein
LHPANRKAFSPVMASRDPGGMPGRERQLSAGYKMMLCMALSISAFVARTPLPLLVLFLLNAVVLLWFRRGPLTLKREIRVLCWQIFIITGLYVLRFGFQSGWVPGFLTAIQLFLAFFPGVIFLQTTPQTQIVMTLEKIMPSRMAFVLAMSIQFMPLMIREIRTIYEAQVFRGARILPSDLINPKNWKDVLHCLLFPSIVQCMVAAHDIATAAKARDFGKFSKRTHWPGG